MPGPACLKNSKGDCTDLWFGGWHVGLPAVGAALIERAEPPAEAEPVPDALLTVNETGLTFSDASWRVRFGDGKPLVLPVEPREDDRPTLQLRRAFYGSRAFGSDDDS